MSRFFYISGILLSDRHISKETVGSGRTPERWQRRWHRWQHPAAPRRPPPSVEGHDLEQCGWVELRLKINSSMCVISLRSPLQKHLIAALPSEIKRGLCFCFHSSICDNKRDDGHVSQRDYFTDSPERRIIFIICLHWPLRGRSSTRREPLREEQIDQRRQPSGGRWFESIGAPFPFAWKFRFLWASVALQHTHQLLIRFSNETTFAYVTLLLCSGHVNIAVRRSSLAACARCTLCA